MDAGPIEHRARDGQPEILDFGCGLGRHTRFLSNVTGQPVLGVDVDAAALERARTRYGDRLTVFQRIEPGSRLPFPAGSFRLIHCYDVLEHVPDPLELLREFRRVLKAGGTLRLEVPAPASERFLTWLRPSYPAEIGHLNVFSKQRLLELVAGVGFRPRTYQKRQSVKNLELAFQFLRKRSVTHQQGEVQTPKILLALFLLFQEEAQETALAFVPAVKLFRWLAWPLDQLFPKSQRLEAVAAA
jgi:SAM-dependent methyltransferase